MPPVERAHSPRQQSALVAGGWIMLASLASAFCVALSLPTGWDFEPTSTRDVFRPEWLVTSTLVVLMVHRAARACWWCALPVVVLPSAQVLYAAETAAARLEESGVGGGGTQVWAVLAAVQVTIFAVAAFDGAGASLRDRRWERFMIRRLGPEAAGATGRFDLAA